MDERATMSHERSVFLRNAGGVLRISGELDALHLDADERELITEICQLLDEFERVQGSDAGPLESKSQDEEDER